MITSKWKGFGSNFTLVKEQVLDWLAWRTAALLSSANKVTCWHFTTWRVLVWRESQLLLSTMNTREDPMSIPQSTLVRICERKVSQIFYKRDFCVCKRVARLENPNPLGRCVRLHTLTWMWAREKGKAQCLLSCQPIAISCHVFKLPVLVHKSTCVRISTQYFFSFSQRKKNL